MTRLVTLCYTFSRICISFATARPEIWTCSTPYAVERRFCRLIQRISVLKSSLSIFGKLLLSSLIQNESCLLPLYTRCYASCQMTQTLPTPSPQSYVTASHIQQHNYQLLLICQTFQPMFNWHGDELIDWLRFNVPPNTLYVILGTGFYRSNDPTNTVKALKEGPKD